MMQQGNGGVRFIRLIQHLHPFNDHLGNKRIIPEITRVKTIPPPDTSKEKLAIYRFKISAGVKFIGLQSVFMIKGGNAVVYRVDLRQALVMAYPDTVFIIQQHAVEVIIYQGRKIITIIMLQLVIIAIQYKKAPGSGHQQLFMGVLINALYYRAAGQRYHLPTHVPHLFGIQGSLRTYILVTHVVLIVAIQDLPRKPVHQRSLIPDRKSTR